MDSETFFRIIAPLLLVAFIAHRGYYVKTHNKPGDATLKKREEGLVSKLAGLLGVLGFIAIVAYTLSPDWLAFAKLSLPTLLRWAGVGLAVLGFALLQWAQVSLGKSWSDTPRMLQGQSLITDGPYRYIRHPIYTAFILILGSMLLITSNWLIGLCWAGMTILEASSRIKFEEALMLEYFGDEYRQYMKRTGRLLPKLIH
jgi:protein-S-isoprenylcysteine O-methyltransferase Ste14